MCSGRRKGGPKRTALKFEHGDEDLTCLEQRLTQAEIDRILGSDLLVRAVFHGQADVTALLEVPLCLISTVSVLFWLCVAYVWQHQLALHDVLHHQAFYLSCVSNCYTQESGNVAVSSLTVKTEALVS